MAETTLGKQVTVATLRDGPCDVGDYAIAKVRGKTRIIVFMGERERYGEKVRTFNDSQSAVHNGKLKKEYREPSYKGGSVKKLFTSDDRYLWSMYDDAEDAQLSGGGDEPGREYLDFRKRKGL